MMKLFNGAEVADMPFVSKDSKPGDRVYVGMNGLDQIMSYGIVTLVDDSHPIVRVYVKSEYDVRHGWKGRYVISFREDGSIKPW